MLATVALTDRAASKVGDLSLGDRKRLEFGMALACDPGLLLLDEPTAVMSINERHYLMELFAQRVDETGKTLLFVEHDIDVVLKIAQRVTVMVRGSVLATGAPAQIAANEQVQAIYLGGIADVENDRSSGRPWQIRGPARHRRQRRALRGGLPDRP